MRKGEPLYAELGLKDRELDDDALIALMVANPILIERPIVVRRRQGGDRQAAGEGAEFSETQYSRLRGCASLASTRSPLVPRPSDFSRRITSQTGKTITAPSRK